MVNATQLSSYIYCPRKLFIGSVLKVKEPVKEALVKGRVWHQTYEFINKNEKDIVKSVSSEKYDDIFDLYRKGFAKFLRNAIVMNKAELKTFEIKLLDLFNEYWPDFEEEAKMRALNVAEFIRAHKIFGDELWEKLTPKILSEQYFKSENFNISGIIDVIEIHDVDDGDLYVPVELKTGKFPVKGMWDGHRIQLGAYLLMLEDNGKKVSDGVLRYRGSDDKRILVMNSMLRDEVLTIAKNAQIILDGLNPPDFTDNKNKCAKCSFKEICYDKDEMKRLIDTKIG
jgi:CRISPR-associated protein Cas4